MQEHTSLNKIILVIFAALVGATVGLSVILFVKLLAFVHNLFFLGQISFVYDERLHTAPSYLGFGVILVPVIGSLIVTWIIDHFAADERGLSVPEIIYSIHFNEGKIRPGVAFAKAIAAIITIGSGGSVGREGPVVQLSAAMSMMIGSCINLTAKERITLIAAGAAAGMAIIFNAPIASLIFAIEILLIGATAANILLILIAQIVALLIKYYFLGNIVVFSEPNFQGLFDAAIFYKHLFLFIPFGLILGLISAIFIRGLYLTEDIFSYLFKNNYVKHAIGMFFVGIMIYLTMIFFGHYYIEGLGIATIEEVLKFLINNLRLLALILIFKLLATFITLGSGGSGGIFAPSLFLGAISGALWGVGVKSFLISNDFQLITYIIAGMAGVLGSVTGGILTAIILCIELTNDTHHILPILITVAVSFMTRKIICEESVYTLKLVRRNIRI